MEAPLTDPELAARIRAEHAAVADALKDSLRHAITAGELLIVAKAQVPHGQWLSWLREHCAISERTAQLYMRVAKNRAEIEANISEGAADLTLSEAAAMLALSSDVRRLFRFVRSSERLLESFVKELEALDNPEDAANVPVIVDDPFAGRTEQETAEWWLFVTFLTCDFAARRIGMKPRGAWRHVEHLRQVSFQNVSEWLGPEGKKFRKLCGMGELSEQFKQDWQAFLAEHGGKSSAEARSEAEAVTRRFEQDKAAGRLKSLRRPSRRG